MGIGLGMLGLGLTSSLVGRQGGSSYSAEAEALFARFTTPPSTTRKGQINTLITSLKTAGVWDKLDALWLMAAADEQAARQNWKQDLYNLTAVSSPTFTADRGFTNNGSTSYLTTGFTPSTAGGQWTLNSAHLGVWSRTNAVTGAIMGGRTTSTTGQSFMTVRGTSDAVTVKVNQDGTITSTNTDSTGDYIARRSVSGSAALYKNGVSLVSGAANSTTLTAVEIVVGGLNTAGVVSTTSTHELAVASLGATLSDAEITAFYNAKLAYLQAVGAA